MVVWGGLGRAVLGVGDMGLGEAGTMVWETFEAPNLTPIRPSPRAEIVVCMLSICWLHRACPTTPTQHLALTHPAPTPAKHLQRPTNRHPPNTSPSSPTPSSHPPIHPPNTFTTRLTNTHPTPAQHHACQPRIPHLPKNHQIQNPQIPIYFSGSDGGGPLEMDDGRPGQTSWLPGGCAMSADLAPSCA